MKKITLIFIWSICFFNIRAQNGANDSLFMSITSSTFGVDTSYVNGHKLFTGLQLTNSPKLKSFEVVLLNTNDNQIGLTITYQLKQTSRGGLFVENNLQNKSSILNNTLDFVIILNENNYLASSKIKINYVDINNVQKSMSYTILK